MTKMVKQTGQTTRNLQNREESFESFSLKGVSEPLSWPYDEPSGELMARLGFFYQPTKRMRDRVKCFGCTKVQSSWAGVQDPSSHHLQKYPSCWFSRMNQYMTQRSLSSETFDWSKTTLFNDPLSKEAIQTRYVSFGSSWPYDGVNGAFPNSSKMVDAGFYYTPYKADDDLAICMYCGISLEGWEEEDDPLVEHQKRSKENGCYFLDALERSSHTTQTKRPSSSEDLRSSQVKRSRKESTINTTQESNISSARPKRRAAQNLNLNEDSSDSDYNPEVSRKVNISKDDSFGLSAHSIELNSEEAQYESSIRTKSIKQVKSTSSTLAAKSKQNTSKVKSSSPIKSTNKILDSSFSADDLFSQKNVANADISAVTKPSAQKSIPLGDITNKVLASSPHKKEDTAETITPQEKEADVLKSAVESKEASIDQISFISNTQNDTNKKLISESAKDKREAHKDQQIDDEEMDTSRYEDIDQDSIMLISNSKEIISGSVEGDSSLSFMDGSPSAAQTSRLESTLKKHETGSPFLLSNRMSMEKENNASGMAINDTQFQNANKSILTHTRFIESPLKRSRSPFLDADYKGSDDITNSNNVIASDDNPIEESTDHNISVPIKSISSEKIQGKELSESLPSDQIHYPLPECSSSDDSFHSMEDPDIEEPETKTLGPGDPLIWSKTSHEALFNLCEDLETAKEYISELSKIPFDLNDDVDGRVSYFINEMPDNEINMTIDEWLRYTAGQGRNHFEKMCTRMLEEYDKECERALAVLRSLPTSNRVES